MKLGVPMIAPVPVNPDSLCKSLAKPKSVIFGVNGRSTDQRAMRRMVRLRLGIRIDGFVIFEQDIRRLEIPVDDAIGMRVVDGTGQLLDHASGGPSEQRFAVHLVRERSAVDEFEREVRQSIAFADVVDLDDVRVLQLGDGERFGFEPAALALPRMGPADNHLERDQPIEALLPRLVDDAHAPAA